MHAVWIGQNPPFSCACVSGTSSGAIYQRIRNAPATQCKVNHLQEEEMRELIKLPTMYKLTRALLKKAQHCNSACASVDAVSIGDVKTR